MYKIYSTHELLANCGLKTTYKK